MCAVPTVPAGSVSVMSLKVTFPLSAFSLQRSTVSRFLRFYGIATTIYLPYHNQRIHYQNLKERMERKVNKVMTTIAPASPLETSPTIGSIQASETAGCIQFLRYGLATGVRRRWQTHPAGEL